MDSTGRIYGECAKCGTEVSYDRDCPKCGTKSENANVLSDMLKGAIVDEIPDPFGHIRDRLIKEHQRKERMGKE